jgi:hypothetical protein
MKKMEREMEREGAVPEGGADAAPAKAGDAMAGDAKASDLKERGNVEFKAGNYENAVSLYGSAIDLMAAPASATTTATCDKELWSTLLINRAAALLKLSKFPSAVKDCEAAIELYPSSTKAYFRLASALFQLGEDKKAYNNLSKLLSMDPKNADGIKLMRDVRQRIQDDERNSTPISRTLLALTNLQTGKDKSIPLTSILKELAGLCCEDKYNALDFGRRGGIRLVSEAIDTHLNGRADTANEPSSATKQQKDSIGVLGLRVFGLASSHKLFVHNFVDMDTVIADDKAIDAIDDDSVCICSTDGKLLIIRIVSLIAGSDHDIATAALHACVQMLKSSAEYDEDCAEAAAKAAGISSLSTAQYPSGLSAALATAFLRALGAALRSGDPILFITAADAFSAFISDSPGYFGTAKLVDSRYENMVDRKERLRAQKYLRDRSERHGRIAAGEASGCVGILYELLDSENPLMRQRAGICFGHLLKSFDDEAKIKSTLQPYIDATDVHKTGISAKSIVPFRKRASLTSALLMSTKSDLGVWALEQREGVQQLLVLISTNDTRCQEVAVEVMCLCASSENGQPLLGPVVSANVLNTLLESPHEGIKAAAAATITKLSLKAKAFENEDTDELTSILNSVLNVLKHSSLSALNNSADSSKGQSSAVNGAGKGASSTGLISFSKLDKIKTDVKAANKSASGIGAITKDDYAASVADLEGGLAYVSVERAIEVLAALVGKTFVKEEIVHGSYRVAPSIGALVAIEVDPRSTAAYGIAHILAALTVTNKELRAKALAEKDMTEEQYEQLAELQRIKTKDVEERKPDVDLDSDVLCKRRIQAIVAAGGLRFLINLITNTTTSPQTKETGARALKQICVDESVRGQFIQQGGIRACCSCTADDAVPKSVRRECAHAISKALVTTNPTLLSEHLRLGCVAPLVMLCKDVDSTNLMQFEACLALTNLTSVGDVEQERLVAEKGIQAVHYLMFSEHKLVRRAATEVFCNMPTNEGVLKLLRKPETVRLWLGICEEWGQNLPNIVGDVADDEDPWRAVVEKLVQDETALSQFMQSESYMTARASAGTLAVAASDEEVCRAVVAENCSGTIICLLESRLPELVHRALVIALNLVNVGGIAAAKHLLEHNVVPALHVGAKLGDANLAGLCKEVGVALSKALKSEEAAEKEKVKTEKIEKATAPLSDLD